MVIRTKHLLLAALIVLLILGTALGLYYYLRPSEENRIRALCSAFTEQISKNQKEGAIPAAAKANTISKLFTEKCHFSVDGLPWSAAPKSREKLKADIFRSRAMFDKISLSFEDLTIRILQDQNKAVITLTAVLRGTFRSGKDIYEVRDLENFLVKEQGEWLFESFKVRKLIKQ